MGGRLERGRLGVRLHMAIGWDSIAPYRYIGLEGAIANIVANFNLYPHSGILNRGTIAVKLFVFPLQFNF